MVKNRIRALATDWAVMLRNGMALGKRVAAHKMVSRYWFPPFVLGKGPTVNNDVLEWLSYCRNGVQRSRRNDLIGFSGDLADATVTVL